MADGAVEYSPLSSITDGSVRREPSWAERLSPLSTENNHSSWVADPEEEDEVLETEDSISAVCSKSVPAKLLTLNDTTDHLLQIQVCWACRLELSQQTQDKKLMRIADENPSLLKLPHFAVSGWDDVAKIIHSDNGVDASDMIFWVKQPLFDPTEAGERKKALSSFDMLCSSSAEEYAKATDLSTSLTFPVEEACLRCRRTSLLPVIVDDSSRSRHAVKSAILFKESALKARAVGAHNKKYIAHQPIALSAPSTPFTTTTAGMKRHVTESPPEGAPPNATGANTNGRRQVVSLFNAIGMNDQNWRQQLNRQYRIPASSRWSPTSASLNTGSTDLSTGGGLYLAGPPGASPHQRRRQGRKNGRRKMSSQIL